MRPLNSGHFKPVHKSSRGGLGVERLLHKKHDSAPVDPIPLRETIPAINMFYVLYGPYSHRRVIFGNEETQLTKLLKPIWTHNPDQNLP